MCGCAGGGLVMGGGLKAESGDSPALAGANMAVPYLVDKWLERQLVKMQ